LKDSFAYATPQLCGLKIHERKAHSIISVKLCINDQFLKRSTFPKQSDARFNLRLQRAIISLESWPPEESFRRRIN